MIQKNNSIIDSDTTSPNLPLTGSIKVNSTCGISGVVSAPAANTTYTLYGQLNNTDKNTITGIYHSNLGDTGTVSFVKK